MKRFLWSAFYICIFALLIYNSFSYLDPDFGWHLRFGEIIWQTKDVPHDQVFMWTLAGKTWVDHEWLGNLGLYGLWSAGGYLLVTFVFALIPLAALMLINRHLLRFYIKRAESIFFLGLLEFAALFFMLPHFGVRLQELTFLCAAILLILLDRFALARRDAKNNSRTVHRLWWIVPLMHIWSSLHGGFLIGLVICALWFALECALAFFPLLADSCDRKPLDKKTLSLLTLIFITAFAATWATPYGPELYSFLGDYGDTYYMAHIQEWRQPYVFPIHYGQLAINFLIIAMVMGTVFLLKKRHLIPQCLLTLMFSIMAFRSVRHFPLLVAAWLILIIPHCLPELTERIRVRGRIVSAAAGLCLCLLAGAYAANARINSDPFNSYCNSYPCEAVDFLSSHPEYAARLYNNYNFGGFMIGVLPEARLFIDGRLPQYPFAGKTILEEYNRFNTSEAGEMLDRYGIRNVLYRQPPPEPHFNWFERYILGYVPGDFSSTSSPLLEYLKTAEDWVKVYEDPLSVIYAKR